MHKRGNSWYSDFWYKGERYTESLGPVSKTVAKEKDRAFRSKVASGEYIKTKNNPPFDKAIDEHLKTCKAKNQPSTYKRYCSSADHLKAHFGKKRIRSIESNEILMRKYMNKRKAQIQEFQEKQGRSPLEMTFTTINRELALMRAMFNLLIKAGKARMNPVSLVTMFDEIEKERILKPDELEKIFSTIEGLDSRYQHLKDLIKIGLNTAMRQNEILGMKKTWVDLKASVITVPREAQKRKIKPKRVPINSIVRPILERRIKQNTESEYVFVNPKTGTRYTRIQNSWTKVIEKAGLKGKPGVDRLRFHDLRHSAATNLARCGKDIKFIAQYLGHQDVKTSARYIHYSDEDLHEGAELLTQVPSKSTTLKVIPS